MEFSQKTRIEGELGYTILISFHSWIMERKASYLYSTGYIYTYTF